VLVGVPAIWNRLYAEFKIALAQQTQKTRVQNRARAKLISQFSLLFGDRLQCVTTGTAPLSKEVMVSVSPPPLTPGVRNAILYLLWKNKGIHA